MSKIAVITGITGQDGAYLAKLLLEKGYIVYGFCRSLEKSDFSKLEKLEIKNHKNLQLQECLLTDKSHIKEFLNTLVKEEPDAEAIEIYNLAAETSIPNFNKDPENSRKINIESPLYWLESIQETYPHRIRFLQASSSEIFGDAESFPQDEEFPKKSRNAYGQSKLEAYKIVNHYRNDYNLHASNIILYNHESPLRDSRFVTQKIIKTVLDIVEGKKDCLELGNLSVSRDWGAAEDYVKAMHLMLQHPDADNYVVATRAITSIRDFVREAFRLAGIELAFENEGTPNEIAKIKDTDKIVLKVNPEFYREEKGILTGDYHKIHNTLNWTPDYSWKEVCEEMFTAEKALRKSEATPGKSLSYVLSQTFLPPQSKTPPSTVSPEEQQSSSLRVTPQ